MVTCKRIFFIFYNMGLGGIQTKMLDVANALAERGVECWVLLDEKGPHDRAFRFDPRVRVVVCWDHPRLMKWPLRRLRRLRFILFVAIMTLLLHPTRLFISMCTLATQIIFFLPWLAQKIVINEDTFPSLEFSYNKPLWGRLRISSMYPKVRQVIAVSRSTYRDLRDVYGVPCPPLVYLPNWTSFSKQSFPRERGRTIDIVYGGRLDAQKQPELMMDFFQKLLTKFPRLVIRIYGDGKLSSVVDQKIRQLHPMNDIRRKPPVADFVPILQRAKLFVFTSLYEGLPFVGIEAMKYGAVIVGLHAPGIDDLVVCGKTGILTHNVADLTTQTLVLMKSLERMRDLRGAAYERARKYFSEKNRDKLINTLLA